MSDDGKKGGPKGAFPPKTLASTPGSQVFSNKPGMMRLPESIESGRRSAAPDAPAPRSARASWSPPSGAAAPAPSSRGALVKGQTISLTDTAISAMPSESKDLMVLHEKDGPFAAEVRILATRLEEMRTRLGYKSFLFTSPGEGDGKTVVAANLALVMSEDSERKIALIDANFRAPRAGSLFNLDQNRGLLQALEGKFPLAQCVARVLGRNLIVLHAGGTHQNPASILSSPKFKSLLAELYQSVDVLLVDAPAAIPHADVPLIAQNVDAVVMIGAAGRTKRAALDKAVETIGRTRVVGSVFLVRGNKGGRPKRAKG